MLIQEGICDIKRPTTISNIMEALISIVFNGKIFNFIFKKDTYFKMRCHYLFERFLSLWHK